MKRWSILLLSLVVATAAPPPSAAANEQDRRAHRWWHSDEGKAVLNLTAEQTATLDKIYRRNQPKQHESMRRLKNEERALSRLIADMSVEEIDIIRQIDRVEAARSEFRKTRTLMVFRMYRVLNVDQRSTLTAWRAQEPRKQGSAQTQPKCH